MSQQQIPAEAVELAAKRIGDAVTYRDVLTILEAAAPYLWEAAYRAGHEDSSTGKYRTWSHRG